MAKIPVRRIAEFVKEHRKEIGAVGSTVIKAGKALNEFISDKGKHSDDPRKTRYAEYQDILKNLHNKNRVELFHYTLKVEKFIEQLRAEQDDKMNVKKPSLNKRINKWQGMLTQIEDRIKIEDYKEYLRLYNNPCDNSEYFKENEKLVEKYKQILNRELLKFLLNNTSNSEDKIKRDFLLD